MTNSSLFPRHPGTCAEKGTTPPKVFCYNLSDKRVNPWTQQPGTLRSQVPVDYTKFKRKGTLVSNQAAAGAKIAGKPRDKDSQGREILTTVRGETRFSNTFVRCHPPAARKGT